MPPLRLIAPIILKEILEAADWKVYKQDKSNWSLVDSRGISVEIPKRGRFVSFQVMENALAQAEITPGDYFRHLRTVTENRRAKGLPEDGIDERPGIIH